MNRAQARDSKNDRYNRLPRELIILVPITTRDRGIPFHLRVAPPEGGVSRVSYLLCDQPRAMSTRRLLRRLGLMREETVDAVQQLVGLFIDR